MCLFIKRRKDHKTAKSRPYFSKILVQTEEPGSDTVREERMQPMKNLFHCVQRLPRGCKTLYPKQTLYHKTFSCIFLVKQKAITKIFGFIFTDDLQHCNTHCSNVTFRRPFEFHTLNTYDNLGVPLLVLSLILN